MLHADNQAMVVKRVREKGILVHFLHQLSSRNKWKRARAVKILATIRTEETVRALVSAIHDPDADIRMFSARALSRIKDPDAEKALLGILATIEFMWRDNRYNGTLFESRYLAEIQALPLVLGPIHAGVYGGYGFAYRWEDTPVGTIEGQGKGNEGSRAMTGGAMLQIDLHTRIALTARMGLVHAHGDKQSDALIGISVY